MELKWMKAEHDKIMDGPDSMSELWMDDFLRRPVQRRGGGQTRNDGPDEQGRRQAGHRRVS